MVRETFQERVRRLEDIVKEGVEGGWIKGYSSFDTLKSNGERLIAMHLVGRGVAHEYERPINLRTGIRRLRRRDGSIVVRKYGRKAGRPFYVHNALFKPDFYLLNLLSRGSHWGGIIEFWGGVEEFKGDKERLKGRVPIDSEGYINSMRFKMAIYHRNNIDFCPIYPDNLNEGIYVLKIEAFLKTLRGE